MPLEILYMKTLNLTLLRMMQLVRLGKKLKHKSAEIHAIKFVIQNNGDTSHITQSEFMARGILMIKRNISQ